MNAEALQVLERVVPPDVIPFALQKLALLQMTGHRDPLIDANLLEEIASATYMRKQKQKSTRAQQSESRKKRVVRESSSQAESAPNAPSATSVADAARQKMISDAAYYRAQKRGFAPGRELDDWLAAEAEISSQFLEQEPSAAELH